MMLLLAPIQIEVLALAFPCSIDSGLNAKSFVDDMIRRGSRLELCNILGVPESTFDRSML